MQQELTSLVATRLGTDHSSSGAGWGLYIIHMLKA